MIVVDGRSAAVRKTTGWERYTRGLIYGLRTLGVEEVSIYRHLGNSRLALLSADWLSLPLKVLRSKASVVHFPTYPPTPVMWGAPTRVRVTWTVHDLTWWQLRETASRLGKNYYSRLADYALSHVAGIVVPSEAVATEMRELFGLESSKICVIPHSVPRPPLAGQPSDAYGLGRPYLLTVGTIEPRKNLPILCEAFAFSGLAAQYDLVAVGRRGWGALSESLPYLRIIEGVSDGALGDIYAGCSAYVSASLYEGFGLPVVEASYFSKPLALSNIAAYREVADSSAVFFNPRDVDSIAQALLKVCGDPPAPRQRAEVDTYTWRDAALAHVRFFDSLASL